MKSIGVAAIIREGTVQILNVRQKEKALTQNTVIIMYIYHALINALSAHMIHINLNNYDILYTCRA